MSNEKDVVMMEEDFGVVVPVVGDIPEHGRVGDACVDLRAAESVVIQPGKYGPVKLASTMAIPEGYFGIVYVRSGLKFKHGVDSSPGIIDSNYRGAIHSWLVNHSSVPFVINKGDRIAQLEIRPVVNATFVPVDELDETNRNDNGFGSSGVR